jgi:hypothetical protein
MPRKKTTQPEPSEAITLSDGTVVEIRNHETREIGRGQDRKFESEEMDNQVLIGLFDDLLSAEPWRHTRATTALESDHAMARYLLDAGYEMDERTARRHGKSIRGKYRVWVRLVEEHNPDIYRYILRPAT